jgi:agmatine deiminase
MPILDQLPDECRMPAEWEPHEGTWIAWPHNRDDWPDKFDSIPWVYAEIVRHLHHCEHVYILVNNDVAAESARDVLERVGVDRQRVHFVCVPTDRVWTRDFAPIFVRVADDSLIATAWQLNGWAKYPNCKYDEAVPRELARLYGWALYEPKIGERRVVLEGGSIDVNGGGLLLTTEECLLSHVQARNPGLTKEDVERVLSETLGIEKVLWLGRGIAGDDTHGHIDDLARFVSPRAVVVASEEDPDDDNYEPLRENLERLRGMTDLDGRPLEVVKLPMPEPIYFMGQRLPASYANFYVANDRVLVPTFNDANDRRALETLARVFPGRTIVGIHSVDLVWGLGTLHCLTQQQPARES